MPKDRKHMTEQEEELYLIKFILDKAKKNIQIDQKQKYENPKLDYNSKEHLNDIMNILCVDRNNDYILRAREYKTNSKNDKTEEIEQFYSQLKKEIEAADKDVEGEFKKSILAVPRFIAGVIGVASISIGETIHFVGAAVRIATKVATFGHYGNLEESYLERGENFISKLGMSISDVGDSLVSASVKPLMQERAAAEKRTDSATGFQKLIRDKNLSPKHRGPA